MKDVVIVSACRTAIGTFGGTLKDLGGWNIGRVAMKASSPILCVWTKYDPRPIVVPKLMSWLISPKL